MSAEIEINEIRKRASEAVRRAGGRLTAAADGSRDAVNRLYGRPSDQPDPRSLAPEIRACIAQAQRGIEFLETALDALAPAKKKSAA